MIRNIVSIETEVGLKKFGMHCESDASLEHCLAAANKFVAYLQERKSQAEQPKNDENLNSD